MGASTHHNTLQHTHICMHGSTLQLSRHHTTDSMSEAVRLPGETARLRALALLHSYTHSMTSQCWHSTHMRPNGTLNAPPVNSSPKASRTCPTCPHNPQSEVSSSLESASCLTPLLRPCKQHASAMRCSATGQRHRD